MPGAGHLRVDHHQRLLRGQAGAGEALDQHGHCGAVGDGRGGGNGARGQAACARLLRNLFAARNLDQIRVSICYANLNVLIAGAHAGVSVGPDGATHQALEDLFAMQGLPNMSVVAPCDAVETRKATSYPAD